MSTLLTEATNKLKAKYRPLLTGAEILTVVTKFQAIPLQERTPLEVSVLTKLATFAYKLQADLVTPTYTASEETNAAYLELAASLEAETNSKTKLNNSELATAKRQLTKEQEWAYCWERFKSGYMLTPSELKNALEHVYLNFTLPADLVSAAETLLSAEAFTNEVVAAIKKVLDEAVVLARFDI